MRVAIDEDLFLVVFGPLRSLLSSVFVWFAADVGRAVSFYRNAIVFTILYSRKGLIISRTAMNCIAIAFFGKRAIIRTHSP